MRRARTLAAGMLATALLVGGRPAAAQQTVEWTVLVYLNGDNSPGQTNLENATISDFNELEQVGSTQNVNVVVQWDRGAGDDNLTASFPNEANQTFTTTRRYLVVRDLAQTDPDPNNIEPNPGANPAVPPGPGYRIASPPLLDLGETDMGQENTLVDFVQWAFGRFPARHYLLVLNDTGRGWQPRSRTGAGSRGIIFDASTTGNAADANPAVYLTNAELRSAMQRIKTLNGNQNLDVLALDAGGMGTLEILYQLRETANYVVAPVLDRPLDGFPYNIWLQRLTAQPPQNDTNLETMLGNFAGDFTGSYGAGSNLLGGGRSNVIGVYRMSQLPAVITAVDNLANALLGDLPTYATGILRALARVQRGRTTDFTYDSVALSHFAETVAAEIDAVPVDDAAAAVAPAIAALLVNNTRALTVGNDLNVDNHQGVGIYFPPEASRFDTGYSISGDFVTATQWDELVQGLLTLNSDQSGPQIIISSPLSGSTIIENPPQIVATIIDQEVGGRVNAASITLTLDGQAVAPANFSYEASTGILTYNIPNALTVTSHTFTITARDLSGNLSTATGSFRIAVPSLNPGIQTFSLPRQVTQAQNNPSLVFGQNNFLLARWVPLLPGANKYRYWPDSYASFIPPDAAPTLTRPTVPQPPAGLGYWVRIQQSRPLPSLPGSPVTLNEYPIQLSANPDGGHGWNMIANPYDVSAVGTASLQVELNNGRRITFRQAIEDRLTPGVLFTYVPNATNPNASGRYDFQDAGEGQLTRLQGHWLRANQDFRLVVNAGARLAQPVAARSGARATPADGWVVQVRADAGDAGYDLVRLGAANETTDGYDRRWDIAAPPSLPDGVEVRVVHGDWGLDSGRYLRDLRSHAPAQTWELDVASPDGEVTLSWPSLRDLPAQVDLSVTDLANGVTRRMRSTAGYSFRQEGGHRPFRVTATRRAGTGLSLGAVTVTAGRGRGFGIGFTLSRGAAVTAVVRSLSGRSLKLVADGAAAAGRGELYWDGRDSEGRPVPSGIYRIEVIAAAPDGATVRELRTVRVTR